MKIFSQLHDATLKQVEFIWAEALLLFYFAIEGKTVCLSAHGVTSISCDRKLPWGPSVSVNEIKIDKEGDASKLTIEMQSGDLIVAWIKTYELK